MWGRGYAPQSPTQSARENLVNKKEGEGSNSHSKFVDIDEIEVPERCLHPIPHYNIGKIEVEGDNLQLLMMLDVFFEGDGKRRMQILIDTGAQINLVKNTLIPWHLARLAPKAVRLITANGQRMEGGERCIDMEIGFQQVFRGRRLPQTLFFEGTFYLADIEVDAIISYPWLREN